MHSLISKCTEMCSLIENALLNLLNVPLNYLSKHSLTNWLYVYISNFYTFNTQVCRTWRLKMCSLKKILGRTLDLHTMSLGLKVLQTPIFKYLVSLCKDSNQWPSDLFNSNLQCLLNFLGHLNSCCQVHNLSHVIKCPWFLLITVIFWNKLLGDGFCSRGAIVNALTTLSAASSTFGFTFTF